MSTAMINYTVVAEIGSQANADQAPVLISWKMKGVTSYSWWLNSMLLTKQEKVQHLKREMEAYFEYTSNAAREQLVWGCVQDVHERYLY